MNIDNLISKYLDGDLTESEDLKLRNLISTDENAKDIYNTYIELHLAAKEDAKSIETPEDIKSETEDRVLMAIMDASAKAQKPASMNVFRLFPKQLVSMVAVLLLVTFTYTSDLNIFRQSTPSYSKAEMVIGVPTVKSTAVPSEYVATTVKSEPEIVEQTENIDKNQINNIESVQLIESTPVYSVSTIYQEEEAANLDVSSKLTTEATEALDQDKFDVVIPNVSIFDGNTTSSNIQYGQINNRMSPTQSNLSVNNIQITAFTSAPYTLYGFDDAANASMNSYSQAVSLSLNSKTKVGLEIGYSDISYLGELYTTTNITDKYGRETGQQITIRTESDKDFALYWGQVFFQSELVKIDNFDMGLRMGFGLSEGGFNTNTKALASYEILDGIKLTAGTEFSYFTVSLPRLVNGYTENYYAFSMIYGLQFDF